MLSEGNLECMVDEIGDKYQLGSIAGAGTPIFPYDIFCSFLAWRLRDSGLNVRHEWAWTVQRLDCCSPASFPLNLMPEFSHRLGRILVGLWFTSWSVILSSGYLPSVLGWLWCYRCWESSLRPHACTAHNGREFILLRTTVNHWEKADALVLPPKVLWVNI